MITFQKKSRFYSRKGFGLLFSLLLLTILAGFASIAFRRSQFQFFQAASYAQHMQALTLAKAGVNISRAGLLMDTNKTDDLEEDWHLLSMASQMSPIPLGNGAISIEILDEERKRNLNTMGEEELKEYFEILGLRRVRKGDITGLDIVEEQIHEELAEAYLDWIDDDDQERPQGAESRWYRHQDFKYIPHNNRIATLAELLWIKGFTREMLLGEKGNPRLLDQVTLYGGNKINVNTASRETLVLLVAQQEPYIADSVADALIEYRPYATEAQAQQVMRGYGLRDDLTKKVAVSSRYFRIVSTGIVGNTRSVVEAVVKRTAKSCDILLWKEMPEVQRSRRAAIKEEGEDDG
ncbi:type II secretion system minor pseudopilin GspK [bacterium]|nr:type II secretion system minor pseudopilin GspK [bacterium]